MRIKLTITDKGRDYTYSAEITPHDTITTKEKALEDIVSDGVREILTMIKEKNELNRSGKGNSSTISFS